MRDEGEAEAVVEIGDAGGALLGEGAGNAVGDIEGVGGGGGERSKGQKGGGRSNHARGPRQRGWAIFRHRQSDENRYSQHYRIQVAGEAQ